MESNFDCMNVITDLYETVVENEEAFIDLALSYGQPIKSRRNGGIIDTLVTLESNQVNKNSLSKRYGIGEFPIHTDCAYLKQPPKYILLRYVGEIVNPTPTIVVHFDESKLSVDENEFLKRTIWFVKSENIGFYSPILKDDILRYDKEVMRMVNSNEDKMIEILSKMDKTEIKWFENKVIILNNHQLLHYRPQTNKEETNKRVLQRINII